MGGGMWEKEDPKEVETNSWQASTTQGLWNLEPFTSVDRVPGKNERICNILLHNQQWPVFFSKDVTHIKTEISYSPTRSYLFSLYIPFWTYLAILQQETSLRFLNFEGEK